MLKKGDIVMFTDEAKRCLGRYSDDLVHVVDQITVAKNYTTVTFLNEDNSDCDIEWLKKVE
jgi:hypothetical protein